MNLQEVYGMSVEEFGEFVNKTISDEDIVEMFKNANLTRGEEEKEDILNKTERTD